MVEPNSSTTAGPSTREARRQRGAVVDRRVLERAAEIDRAAALSARLRRCSAASFGMLRPLDHAEAGDAEIDQLDLLLAGIIVAEGAQMRGVEGARSARPGRTHRSAPPGAATRTSIDWPA